MFIFIAQPAHWSRNLKDARRSRVSPAIRIDPSGVEHPGIRISYGSGMNQMLILDHTEATRLATELIDAITASRQQDNRE